MQLDFIHFVKHSVRRWFVIVLSVLVTLCSDPDGTDCLHAAVSNNLTSVVESLCQRGASLDARDSSKEPAVWQALTAGAYEVADVLVRRLLLPSV